MARTTEKQIELALGRALDGLAVVETVEPDAHGARVSVRSPKRMYSLRTIWAGAGWPADVDRAIHNVGKEWPPDLVVVARHLSSGSRELLERRGASWVDGSGNAHIVAPDLLVVRDVQPPAGAEPPRFSWSPSAVSIAEALLNGKSPSGVRTTELAMLTGWSTPQVSQVLAAFDAEGWTTKLGAQRGPGASREIVDAARMLDAWTAEVSRLAPERRFAERIFDDPLRFLVDELAPVLDKHGIGWAVTGWAAAEELAPFATVLPTLQLYIEDRAFWGPLTEAMEDVPLRDVEAGGRVEFRSADPHALRFAARRNGISLATAPRVFADLRALGGRGEDAAIHLRDELILRDLRPSSRKTPSADMDAWETRCQARLKKRIAEDSGDAATVYASGNWSVSYWIPGVTLSLGGVQEALTAVAGRETGWPPWWVPTRKGSQPEIRDAGLECWFREYALRRDYEHSDYWRAESGLKLFLLRPYQEDRITGVPGSAFDPVLPVWRVAESLLHAERMARYVSAENIEFFARWTGLENRELRAVTPHRWDLEPSRAAHDDGIATYVRTSPDEIDHNLPSVVRALVSPLFEVFGVLNPPGSLYAVEVAAMLERRRSQAGG